MAIESRQGPAISLGQQPNFATAPTNAAIAGVTDYNQDAAPDAAWAGNSLLDPRYFCKIGQNNAAAISGTPQAITWLRGNGGYITIDQLPAPVTVGNIAASQHATTTGTALSLATTTTSAVNLTTTTYTCPMTGKTVPAGVLLLDSLPQMVLFGQTGAVQNPDPSRNLTRTIAIVASSGAPTATFLVSGYDLYAYPQTEQIVAASGSGAVVTTTGKKDFKWIASVVPQGAAASNYDVRTSDTIGFPIRVDELEYTTIWMAGVMNASTSGFTAASTSTAASNTGSVRGTYVLPSASDGVKRLAVFIAPSVSNVSSSVNSAMQTGLFGVTPG